mmetsp:Transcript_77270/g.208664  ORF Transcript_77270/g.208664 Transcript_77270/m.208664 type:complete len:121 (-) Transcript_77270:131-493(-)
MGVCVCVCVNGPSEMSVKSVYPACKSFWERLVDQFWGIRQRSGSQCASSMSHKMLPAGRSTPTARLQFALLLPLLSMSPCAGRLGQNSGRHTRSGIKSCRLRHRHQHESGEMSLVGHGRR